MSSRTGGGMLSAFTSRAGNCSLLQNSSYRVTLAETIRTLMSNLGDNLCNKQDGSKSVWPHKWIEKKGSPPISSSMPQSLYLSFLPWNWPIAILSFPGLFHRRFLGFFLARFSPLFFSMIALGNFLF